MGLDGAIAQDMFLDDLLHEGGRDVAVPGAIWIDEEDRALLANSEAVGFGAKDDAGTI